MNLLENTSFLISTIIILSLIVIFILIIYLRQKKQLEIEKKKARISESRVNLFFSANSDRETMFDELSKAKPDSLRNKYLKEKIKTKLTVRCHDISTFLSVLKMIDTLPDDVKEIIEALLIKTLTDRPAYYLGSLLSRSIIESPSRKIKSKSREVLESTISICDENYKLEVYESTVKYINGYIRRRHKRISDESEKRLKIEIKKINEEIKLIKNTKGRRS